MDAKTGFTASRRSFLRQGGALAAAAALLGPAQLLAAEPTKTPQVEVTPTEDLMREHGVLRRLLLIFEDFERHLGRPGVSPVPLNQAADIMRRFIQDYHEKDEEEYLFGRFEKAGKLVDLVKVLSAQHQAGRKLIADLGRLSTTANLDTPPQIRKIKDILRAFIRMYRPHAAWEDTVLYPAFRSVITPKEFDALGDQFEDKEQKLFGKDGFEKIVAEVAGWRIDSGSMTWPNLLQRYRCSKLCRDRGERAQGEKTKYLFPLSPLRHCKFRPPTDH